jgi:hypothetical protein
VNENNGFVLHLDTAGNWAFNYSLYFVLTDPASSTSTDFYSWCSLTGTSDVAANPATATGSGTSGYLQRTSNPTPALLAFKNVQVSQAGSSSTVSIGVFYYGSMASASNDIIGNQTNAIYQGYIRDMVAGDIPHDGQVDLSGYSITVTPSGIVGFPF